MNKTEILERYKKSRIATKYWLLGREYYRAAEALDFANSYHTGTRKDGVTPEFCHQIEMLGIARVYERNLIYPEDTFSAILLHDVIEDYGVSVDVITQKFGERAAIGVLKVSKKKHPKDRKMSVDDYYAGIQEDPIATVVKGVDRITNIQSMVNVFTEGGQKWYIEETEKFILKVLHVARKKFPTQEPIYENIKYALKSRVDLIKIIHDERYKDT